MVLMIALVALGAFAGGLWIHDYLDNQQISTNLHSVLKTEGVEICWDAAHENKTEEIDWGNVRLGTSNNVTLYVQNAMALPIEAHISTAGWQPTGISDYVNLTWNYSNTILNVGEIMQIALTLSLSNSNSAIDYITGNNATYCSFNVTVSAFSFIASLPANILVDTPAGEQGNTLVLPQISGREVKFEYRDTGFEQFENLDFALLFAYFPGNSSRSTVWVSITVADSLQKINALYNLTDFNGTVIDSKSIQIIQTPSIVGCYLAIRWNGTSPAQLLTSWNGIGLFKIDTTVQQRYFQIRLIAYANQDSDIPELENELLAVATAIASYWEY